MYIGYLNDRKELGFSCIKDIDAIKQLSNFKSTFCYPYKEVLVAVFIFLKSSYVEPKVNPRSFT